MQLHSHLHFKGQSEMMYKFYEKCWVGYLRKWLDMVKPLAKNYTDYVDLAVLRSTCK